MAGSGQGAAGFGTVAWRASDRSRESGWWEQITTGAVDPEADKYSARPEAFCAPLLRFYLREVSRDARMAAVARRLAHDRLALGPNKARISLALGKGLWDEAWKRARKAGIKEHSEVIRGIILAAAIDARLDEPRADAKPSKERFRVVEAIAASV
jgi:hypothetical protein